MSWAHLADAFQEASFYRHAFSTAISGDSFNGQRQRLRTCTTTTGYFWTVCWGPKK